MLTDTIERSALQKIKIYLNGKTMKQKKLNLALLFFILISARVAIAEEEYDGIVLSDLGGMQYEVCQLRPGKTLKDADDQVNFAASEFQRLNLELGIINFTPFFDNATASIETADYITMVYGSIPAFAEGWEKWENSERAAEVMASRSEVGDCHFKFNHVLYKYMDVPALEANPRRIIQTEWCKAKPGVTSDQLKAKHDSWLDANKDDLSMIGWAIILPQLGQASRKGSFMHFVIYDGIGSLMKNQNWLANGDGAAAMQDYYNSYADCEGPSVWDGTLAQRPAS